MANLAEQVPNRYRPREPLMPPGDTCDFKASGKRVLLEQLQRFQDLLRQLVDSSLVRLGQGVVFHDVLDRSLDGDAAFGVRVGRELVVSVPSLKVTVHMIESVERKGTAYAPRAGPGDPPASVGPAPPGIYSSRQHDTELHVAS